MREITPNLTPDLERFLGNQPVYRSRPYDVSTYHQLVEQVAKLAFYNKDHILFFRGQDRDYKSKGDASTFYPSIYRGEPLLQSELDIRFEVLEDASRKLCDVFENMNIEGNKELARKQYIQWSILQHYGVCSTPLLDFTHSIRVACSFAQAGKRDDEFYVFVFGLPYVTNRISRNSEHDLVNVRLLSICPPDAIRPYFQDGYLAGTEDITNEYESKTELDFRNRLIAKFRIPNTSSFWGRGFSRLPNTVLYPTRDRIADICSEIKPSPKPTSGPAEIGDFLLEWTSLEGAVMSRARDVKPHVQSLVKAMQVLDSRGLADENLARSLHQLRRFRNDLVHRGGEISPDTIRLNTSRVREARRAVASI